MKTVKPQRLGVLHRCFERGDSCYFVATVMVCFGFETPDVPIHEALLWKLVADKLGSEGALDECMWKTRGEVLVAGSAYPAGGEPSIGCAVRLKLGPVDKRLYVIGDRHWQATGPSDPEPFAQMPLTWTNAFGGEGFDDNPTGKGAVPVVGEDGGERHPLPNVEDPKRLITAKRDRPRPVGLGAISLDRPIRRKWAGTYDKAWLKKRFPGFPDDMDWRFFNVAPEDQWIEEHFEGGESFSIEHMHPDKPQLEGRLPQLKARCWVTRQGDEDKTLHEIPLRFDTVQLFPDVERGIAIFHGVTEVTEDDAADLSEILLACEAPDSPKPASHYHEVLLQRLDKEKGALYALRDGDLLPPLPEGTEPMGWEELSDLAVLAKREGFLEENLQRRAEEELEQARELCRQNDIDPDEHLPKEVPAPTPEEPDLENLDTFVEQKKAEAEQAQVEAEQRKEEAFEEARKLCAEQDIDFDEVVAKANDDSGGPPTFKAEEELEKLKAMKELAENSGVPLPAVDERLADPELLEKLEATEAELLEAYRKHAQYFPAATVLQGDEALGLRATVQVAVDAGESLAGRDLTGANLSGMKLGKVDLTRALLEAVDLSDADLSGATLDEAVLVRANLKDAKLVGARLVGTNLGEARLHGTDLSQADLSQANLIKAELVNAKLDGAVLEKAFLLETVVKQGSFAGVRARQLLFHQMDLSDVSFVGAELPEALFIETRLVRADFTGALLEGACMLGVQGGEARFDDGRCDNLRVVYESALPGASFRRTQLAKSNFRGTNLAGADLDEAVLPGADLSEANLEEANLERIVAPDALLIRTNLARAKLSAANLMQAVLQKANVEGADFRDANLFRGDFARIKGNKETCFEGANMNFIRFVERGDHER